jgi:hypothetical protein
MVISGADPDGFAVWLRRLNIVFRE